ncbi:MAG: sugar ABC transporter permease, partial [Pseudomonadota bacterium]
MHPALQGLVTIIIGVGGCVGYFYFANLVLDRFIFPAKGAEAGRNINRANAVRPWLFLLPAMAALGLYLVYPVFGSFYRSLFDRAGDGFVGFGNYIDLIGDEAFRTAFTNNLLWVLVVPAAATFLGLLVAQLTDRLSWGNIAKSLIFMPMAISFVGASLIWRFV